MSVGFLLAMAGLAGGIIGLDQLLKWIVLERLVPLGSVTCIPGLLNWTYVENRGAAFGLLQNQQWLFNTVTILMVVVCIFYILRTCRSKWVAVALTLVVGGGIGNLLDRVFRGFVVDFISFSFFSPVFNFADACVVIGGVLLIFITMLEVYQDWKALKQKKAKVSEEPLDDERENHV